MLSVSVVRVSGVFVYKHIHGERTFLATSRISGMSQVLRTQGKFMVNGMNCYSAWIMNVMLNSGFNGTWTSQRRARRGPTAGPKSKMVSS